jgi:hypothetical protein
MARIILSCLVLLLAGCEAIAGIPERTRASSPCGDFCELALRLCTKEYTIYQMGDCEPMCLKYTDDERECRLKELKDLQTFGQMEASVHCANASPSGGVACGESRCENYCSLMESICGNYPEGDDTREECEAKCDVIPDKHEMSRSAGASDYDVKVDHEGDTLQCRFVHLTLASLNDGLAEEHCPHAYVSPLPMSMGTRSPYCGSSDLAGEPRCDDYCHVVMEACVDTNDEKHQVYDDEAQCQKACEAMDKGNLVNYRKENTVACRKYHSYNAAVFADPTTHCPHAGPGGASVCGEDCQGLCTLIEKGCQSDFEEKYSGSRANCERECDTARKQDPTYNDGKNYSIANVQKGNAFACRLYSAAKSLSLAGDAQEVCDVAVGNSPCPFPEK